MPAENEEVMRSHHCAVVWNANPGSILQTRKPGFGSFQNRVPGFDRFQRSTLPVDLAIG